VEEGAREGKWIFLSNLDLMIGWASKLEKLLDDIGARGGVNDQFRLWLSSRPHPQFPITLLQRSVKITTQPPKGLKQNMLRILKTVNEQAFFAGKQGPTGLRYRKLLFALTFFHSVLLERSKFRTLGFNITYDFGDSDFSVSDLLLSKLLE
jgi:dynein heavy chain